MRIIRKEGIATPKEIPEALARKERIFRKNTRSWSGDTSCLSFNQVICSSEKEGARNVFFSCGLRKRRSEICEYTRSIISPISGLPPKSILNPKMIRATRKTAHNAAVNKRLLKGFFCSGKTFLINFFMALTLLLLQNDSNNSIIFSNYLRQGSLDKKHFLCNIDYPNTSYEITIYVN